MHIREFIEKYTMSEVDKIERHDVMEKFSNKTYIQKIATTLAIGQRETSPIRSP